MDADADMNDVAVYALNNSSSSRRGNLCMAGIYVKVVQLVKNCVLAWGK
jgi:hypothetical protein